MAFLGFIAQWYSVGGYKYELVVAKFFCHIVQLPLIQLSDLSPAGDRCEMPVQICLIWRVITNNCIILPIPNSPQCFIPMCAITNIQVWMTLTDFENSDYWRRFPPSSYFFYLVLNGNLEQNFWDIIWFISFRTGTASHFAQGYTCRSSQAGIRGKNEIMKWSVS